MLRDLCLARLSKKTWQPIINLTSPRCLKINEDLFFFIRECILHCPLKWTNWSCRFQCRMRLPRFFCFGFASFRLWPNVLHLVWNKTKSFQSSCVLWLFCQMLLQRLLMLSFVVTQAKWVMKTERQMLLQFTTTALLYFYTSARAAATQRRWHFYREIRLRITPSVALL